MTLKRLDSGWKIAILEKNEQSPMERHGEMEMAVDDERKVIWVFQLFVVVYGLAGVISACEKYISSTT